jgi:hypothetical protein
VGLYLSCWLVLTLSLLENAAFLIGFFFGIGVFTLLTISIGEELESRFFKVTSCVSLYRHAHNYKSLLILIPSGLGINGIMRHHVARGCCKDSAALFNRQDVLCTLSRYRSVPKKSRGDRLCRLEKRSVIT